MPDEKFLKLLCCPRCRGALRTAGDDIVLKINDGIQRGIAKKATGAVADRSIEGGFLCDCSSHLYPIRDRVANLLIDESIALL